MTTLTAAMGVYDRTRALFDGRVSPSRYSLDLKALSYGEISARTFGSAELDLGEVSLGGLLAALDRGNRDYAALPAFLSMGFRHDALYVRADSALEDPRQLQGKRIGLPEFYGTTAIWLRGMLQDLHGVDFRASEWIVAGVERGKPPRRQSHDESINCRYVEERTLEELLLVGEIDALISHRRPAGLADGTIRPLWRNLEMAEAAYFRETGVIPLLHLPVVRRSLLDEDSEAYDDLQRAFLRARDLALEELRQTVVFGISLPSIGRALDRTIELVGMDFWPYGVAANHAALEAFLRYAHEQKLTASRLAIKDVFAQQ